MHDGGLRAYGTVREGAQTHCCPHKWGGAGVARLAIRKPVIPLFTTFRAARAHRSTINPQTPFRMRRYFWTILFLLWSVLLSAQFSPLRMIPGGHPPETHAFVDMDSDGDIDLLEIEEARLHQSNLPRWLRWRENITDNALNRGSYHNLVSIPQEAHIRFSGDLNDDALPDYVLSVIGERGYRLYSVPGETAYTLAQLPDDPTLPHYGEYNAADWDGDGIADLTMECDGIFYYWRSTDATSATLLNTGFDLLSDAEFVDMDGDGLTDILFFQDQRAVYFRYLGNGAFADAEERETQLPDTYHQDHFLMDIDGNGTIDLLHNEAGNVVVYRYQSNHTFANPETHLANTEFLYTLDEDFDDDGLSEYVVLSYENGVGTTIYLDRSSPNTPLTATAIPAEDVILTNVLLHRSLLTTDQDVDGDGLPELIFPANNGLALDIFFNNATSDPFTETPLTYNLLFYHSDVSLIHAPEGDYRNTVLWIDQPSAAPAQGYHLTSLSTTSARVTPLTNIAPPGTQRSIYLDDDPLPDLVATTAEPNGWVHYFYRNLGNNNFAVANPPTQPAPYSTSNHEWLDVDLDGDTDLIHSILGDPLLYWQENVSGILATSQVLTDVFPQSSTDHTLAIDFNQDGFPDLINGNDPASWLALGNPDGSYSIVNGPVIPTDDMPVVGQFTADNYPDLAWINYTEVMVLKNTNGDPAAVEVISASSLSYPRSLVIHNFDGSPGDDIVFGTNNSLIFLKNDGTGNFEENTISISPKDVLSPHLLNFLPSGVIHVAGESGGQLLLNHDNYNSASNGADLIPYYLSFGEASAAVTMRTYHDANENGQLDADESFLRQIVISADPAAVAKSTNAAGITRFFGHEGENYTINVTTPDNWTATGALQFTGQFSTATADTLFVGFTPSGDQPTLAAHLSSGTTRCGFTVPFWLSVINNGSVSGPVESTLHLDARATVVQAPAQWTQTADTVWTHTSEEPLTPTQQTQTYWLIEMPGVEYLGTQLNVNLDHALLDVASNPVFTGSTSFQSEINCAYDPNDKLVHPSYPDMPNYGLLTDELQYTIRFQNTGTDTAFTVRIEDQLAPTLDLRTLALIGSSHPVEYTLTDDRVISFLFENILLPDSTTNLEGSQGFVSFKINPVANLPPGSKVANEANIYFDFNPPILTNTVTSVLVDEVPADSPMDEVGSKQNIRIVAWPNPTQRGVQLDTDFPIVRVDLIDTFGRKFPTDFLPNTTDQIQLPYLPSGIYRLLVTTSEGRGSTTLLITD